MRFDLTVSVECLGCNLKLSSVGHKRVGYGPLELIAVAKWQKRVGFQEQPKQSGSRSTIIVTAKASDKHYIQFPNGTEFTGYMPEGMGIGYNDNAIMEIDIETGELIGWNEEFKRNILRFQDYLLWEAEE